MVRLTSAQKRMMWLSDRLLEERFDTRPRRDRIAAWTAELDQLRAVDPAGWFLIGRYYKGLEPLEERDDQHSGQQG